MASSATNYGATAIENLIQKEESIVANGGNPVAPLPAAFQPAAAALDAKLGDKCTAILLIAILSGILALIAMMSAALVRQ